MMKIEDYLLKKDAWEAIKVAEGLSADTKYIVKDKHNNHTYFLRIFSQNSSKWQRENNVLCNKIAAELKFNAEFIESGHDFQYLLTEFLEGSALKPEDLDGGLLRKIAMALKGLHCSASLEEATMPVAQNIIQHRLLQHYKSLLNRSIKLPEVLHCNINKVLELGRYICDIEDVVNCHGDPTFANLMDNCGVLKLIDWEFGGLGNKFIDLGIAITLMCLNTQQEQQFLQAYFGKPPTDYQKIKLEVVKCLQIALTCLLCFEILHSLTTDIDLSPAPEHNVFSDFADALQKSRAHVYSLHDPIYMRQAAWVCLKDLACIDYNSLARGLQKHRYFNAYSNQCYQLIIKNNQLYQSYRQSIHAEQNSSLLSHTTLAAIPGRKTP